MIREKIKEKSAKNRKISEYSVSEPLKKGKADESHSPKPSDTNEKWMDPVLLSFVFPDAKRMAERLYPKEFFSEKEAILYYNDSPIGTYKEPLSHQNCFKEGLMKMVFSLAIYSCDPLTGLMNRRAFMAACNQKGDESANYPISAIILDADHFKKINDHYGHKAGDQALKIMANVLKRMAKKYNMIPARWGGEEFVATFFSTGLNQSESIAEEIRLEIIKRTRNLEKLPDITVSIGIASFGSYMGKQWLDTLISLADSALALAKKNGRNCCISYGEGLKNALQESDTEISSDDFTIIIGPKDPAGIKHEGGFIAYSEVMNSIKKRIGKRHHKKNGDLWVYQFQGSREKALKNAEKIIGFLPHANIKAGICKNSGRVEADTKNAFYAWLYSRNKDDKGAVIFDLNILTFVATDFLEKGDHPAAHSLLQEAYSCGDKSLKCIVNLAVCKIYMGKTKEAAQLFEGAIKMYGDINPTIGLNYGMLLIKLKKYKKALVVLEKVMKLRPDAPQLLNNFAYANLYANGDIKKSLDMVNKALDIEGNGTFRYAYLDTKGLILEKMGRLSEARRCFEEAWQLGKNIPTLKNLSQLKKKMPKNEDCLNK